MSDRWVQTQATWPLDSHPRPRRLLSGPEWLSLPCFLHSRHDPTQLSRGWGDRWGLWGLQGEAGVTDAAACQTLETAHDHEGSRNSQTWCGGGGEARTTLCLGHTLSELGEAGDHGARSSQCASDTIRRAHPSRRGEKRASAHHLSWEDPLKPRWSGGQRGDETPTCSSGGPAAAAGGVCWAKEPGPETGSWALCVLRWSLLPLSP